MNQVIVLSPDQFRTILREELQAFRSKPQQGRFLTPQEAANALGNHTREDVIRLCRKGEIAHTRKGDKKRSKYLIWSEDLTLFSQNASKQEGA